MKKLIFKTTVKCNGCKAAITPYLDGEPTIKDWRVDIFDPNRLLTVEGDDVQPEVVIALLQKAGYQGELMS